MSRLDALVGTFLTAQGRVLLERRLEDLDAQLRLVTHQIESGEESENDNAVHLAALLTERSALGVALRNARAVESLPEDPGSVLIGDLVQIRVGRGPVESFVVVDPVEATVDDGRISTDCPLGRALLGVPVGAEIQVVAPGGTYRCKVLRSDRP